MTTKSLEEKTRLVNVLSEKIDRLNKIKEQYDADFRLIGIECNNSEINSTIYFPYPLYLMSSDNIKKFGDILQSEIDIISEELDSLFK